MKLLDALFSRLVRQKGACQKCGGKLGLQAHHAFGRKNLSVRWSMLNLVCLCYPCHIFWAHRDVLGFATWYENRLGKENYEYLKKTASSVAKWTDDELWEFYGKTKNDFNDGKVQVVS